MKNRVYGVIGIKTLMGNWNAGFDNEPKKTYDGNIFGSDKALKYSIKKYWEENYDEKILGIKSLQIVKDLLQPLTLEERYNRLFGKDAKENAKELYCNLLSCIDVQNFGVTFASKKSNIGITGVVQIGQGLNKYENSNIQTQTILSPYRNSNDKSTNSIQTSIGSQTFVNECHYFYGFSVNPNAYNNLKNDNIIDFEYTEEMYNKFKEAALNGATSLNTTSKFGSDNEFGLFIKMKEGSKKSLGDLSRHIKFYKEDNQDVIDLTSLSKIFNLVEIENIEIYYDTLETKIVGLPENAIIKDIMCDC